MTDPVTGRGSALLVGIDLGSQSAKVVVYDAQGGVVAEGGRRLAATVRPRPGQVEHPGDDLWEALAFASRQAMAALGDRRERVVGVGLCGIRSCRALVRADGTLASPVQSWMDERVSRPYEHRDEAVARVTASSGYLTHRLTGRFRDSVAAYRGQWPVDLSGWAWSGSPEDVRATGIRPDQLVELCLPGDRLGEVSDAAAEATGLPPGVPVLATANDKAVEALGSGLRSPGTVLLSLGTYIAAMCVGEQEREGRSFWTNFASVPHEYLHESTGIRRGMWTVSWLRDLLSSDEDTLNAAAAEVPAGADGLVAVLDWLAPTDEPWRRGAFVGLDAHHGAGHLHRAVLEGIALTMHRHARAMTEELGRGLDELVVSGGGGRSELVLQVVADSFGVPVIRHDVPSAASLGAAICAAVGLGVHPGWDEACAAMVHPARRVEPDAVGVRAYAALAPAHAQITSGVADLLHAAATDRSD